MTDGRQYRVKEFAELAGVTVRTLHHDRVGLLKAHRNASGFRVYTSEDLERLESVIALKFIGLPLKQIRAVIAGDMQDRGRTLQLQIFALEEKKRRLEITINTVRATEATIRSGGKPCVEHIVEVIDRLARSKPETWTELQ